MSRHPRTGKRVLLTAAFTAFASLLAPTAHSEAAVNSHFSLKLHDSFTYGINYARWGAYEGQPGGNPYGWWKPSHVMGYKGNALLRGYADGGRYATGGMMLNSIKQTYGKYVVRARFDRTYSIEHCMLLWPTSGWPPEIDFAEGPGTGTVMATSHWGSDNRQMHAFRKVDMTQWHTYGVEWHPDHLTFTIDGVGWAVMRGDAVPHQPMTLAIQTAATRAVSLSSPEVRMDISDVWVWGYR